MSSHDVEAEEYPTRIRDEAGRERLYTYDAFGSLETATDLAGELYTYAYGEAQLISVTTPLNQTPFVLGYDADDNINSITYPDGSTRHIVSAISGEPLTVTQPSGTEIFYSYTDRGNLLSRVTSTGENHAFSYDTYDVLTQTVDDTGATQYLYNDYGDLEEIQYPNEMHIGYGYDIVGNVVTVTTQVSVTAPVYETNYTYNTSGDLTQVTDPFGGITTFENDELGRPITRTLPNGVKTIYDYHPLRDWVTSVTHLDASNQVLASVTYEYDENGLTIGEPEKIIREDGSYVLLEYDTALRLTSEAYYDNTDSLVEQMVYAYDLDGNREVVTHTQNITDVFAYTYDPGYQLTGITSAAGNEVYQHDADGRLELIARDNVTHTLTYDSHDHVTAVSNNTGTMTYAYDAMGRRVQAVDSNGERHFLVAPMAMSELESPHLVKDENGLLVAGFVYVGGQPLLRFDDNGDPVYYLSDGVGSVIGLANDSGDSVANFAYDSFGNLRTSSGSAQTPPTNLSGDFRYQGTWLETETNLYHFRARDYDARTGRFLSRDAADPFLERPETLNPYGFALANPHLYQDPSGYVTLVNINAAQVIQQTLRSLPKKAILKYVKQAVRSAIGDQITYAIADIFKGLASFADKRGDNYWHQQFPSDPGKGFENVTLTRVICPIISGTALENYLWLEVSLTRRGVALGGHGCSQRGQPLPPVPRENLPTGGHGTPNSADFLLSAHHPGTLSKKTFSLRKAFLIGDYKISNAVLHPNHQQTRRMAKFAKKYQFLPFMMYLMWKEPGPRSAKDKILIIKKYQVMPFFIALKN